MSEASNKVLWDGVRPKGSYIHLTEKGHLLASFFSLAPPTRIELITNP